MNLLQRLALAIFTLITCVVFFFYLWIMPEALKYEGIEALPGLKKNVDVFTDNYGVPHVFAKNEDDLFYVAGYIAGRERLFQLSMVALAVRGELASALGDDYISNDIYLRTWRIHDVAKKMVGGMKPLNKKIFDSFCKGINFRINEVKNDLPVEFKILGISPPEWDPSIVAGYARLMAHEMQGSWKPEIVFGAISSYFGKEKLLELIPGGGTDTPTITGNYLKSLKPAFDKIIDNEFFLRDLFGEHNADIGSNNWVISGDLTSSGSPLLANAPPLAHSQPPRWFEMQLKGGRFTVSGVCIAGIPIPVIGQNERVAWGFTNSMVDDLDFFIETIDIKDKNRYIFGSESRPMKIVEEKIPLKNGRDSIVTIRSTHHGPLISDIHPLLKNKNVAMSMSWTGHWETKEMDAWIGINTMKNWDDFTKELEMYGVPGQNIVYADVDGNIGWRPAVYIPIRREGFSMVPRPGNDPSYDWKGKIPYKDMPFLYNPKKGYISTANNKTIDNDFPYYISGLWADPSRSKRIKKRLEGMKSYTVQDMKSIQLDQTSEFAKEVLPYLIDLEKGGESVGLKRAFEFLKVWDGEESVDSEAALLFHAIMRNLVLNIYEDELSLLGDKYMEAYTGLKYLVHRKLREILKTGESSWIDDINTKGKIESIEEIIYQSIVDGYEEVINTFGENWTNWKWGDAHTLTHKHTLSKVEVLNKVFNLNVGPYRSGGSDKTPNAGGYSTLDPYKQTSGASMRRIVDLGRMNETQFVLPTGQSGLPGNPHYKDQAGLYHKGLYRTTWFDEKFIRKSDSLFRHLMFTP